MRPGAGTGGAPACLEGRVAPGQRMASPLEPPEGTRGPEDTLSSVLRDLLWISELHNCKVLGSCCLKHSACDHLSQRSGRETGAWGAGRVAEGKHRLRMWGLCSQGCEKQTAKEKRRWGLVWTQSGVHRDSHVWRVGDRGSLPSLT